ncbi:hypothetical protein ACVFYP_19640 [Roseomonas sp. F4]
MSLTFFRLPVASDRPDLPSIDLSAARPVFGTPLEADALGHWLLGPDPTSLIDVSRNVALTLQGAGPSFAEAFATVSGVGNALLTPKLDSLQQTLCMVVRRPAPGANTILGGSLRFADGSGSSLHVTTSATELRSSIGGAFIAQAWPAGIAVGDWMFVALSESLASEVAGDRHAIQHIGGAAPVVAAMPAGRTLSSGGGRVALGNAYYNNSSWITGAPAIAEPIVYDRAVSAEELLAIYARSKARMAARGIVVR